MLEIQHLALPGANLKRYFSSMCLITVRRFVVAGALAGLLAACPAPLWENPDIISPPVPVPPPDAGQDGVIPVARPVPGREGLVFSPFNGRLIDVKGFASGALAADPAYPREARKFFRVP